MAKTEYWLGTVKRDRYGAGWDIKPGDGPHDNAEGVVQAKKLMDRIFKRDEEWVMIVVSDVPEIDVEIDEESADICADTIERYRIRHGVPFPEGIDFPGEEAFGSK